MVFSVSHLCHENSDHLLIVLLEGILCFAVLVLVVSVVVSLVRRGPRSSFRLGSNKVKAPILDYSDLGTASLHLPCFRETRGGKFNSPNHFF